MAIQPSELKLYRSATVTRTGANGGRLSASEVVSGNKNNIFPDIFERDRANGAVFYRKLFFKLAQAGNASLNNARVYLGAPTPSGTRLLLAPGTQRDNQADFIATPPSRWYGAGTLQSSAGAGATELVVDVEVAADGIFQEGDSVVIADGANKEIAAIASGGVAWNGNQATLTLEAGVLHDYAAHTANAPVTVSSCIAQSAVTATLSDWVENGYPLANEFILSGFALDNIGTIEQNWTLTYIGSSEFSVVGDTVGSIGTGAGGVNFAPSNARFARPFFTLFGLWTTRAVGFTVTFKTHPAALPFWAKLVVPAGTAAGDGPETPVIHLMGE
jgi:hypothetical protein